MNHTLFIGIDNRETSSALKQLFIDLEYLGHIKKYGSCCLFINTLVQRILQTQGFKTELKTCNAIVERSDIRFLLGGKQFAKPGQLATHVVCVVDDSILIDFGLGVVRREFYPDFFQLVVLPYDLTTEHLSQVQLNQNSGLYYINDSAPENLTAEQALQESTLQITLQEYARYQKNRFFFSLTRAFRSMGLRPRAQNQSSFAIPNELNTKFEDRYRP